MSSVCWSSVDRGIQEDVGRTDVGPGGTKEEEAPSGSNLFNLALSVCAPARRLVRRAQRASAVVALRLDWSGPALQPSKGPRRH